MCVIEILFDLFGKWAWPNSLTLCGLFFTASEATTPGDIEIRITTTTTRLLLLLLLIIFIIAIISYFILIVALVVKIPRVKSKAKTKEMLEG